MKSPSKPAIVLAWIFAAIMTALINPACSESTGPGRENEIQENIAIFDQFAVWSGIHNLVAYAQLRPPDSTGTDTLGIYVVRPDGEGKRMIYQYGDAFVSGLDWSEDGNWLITNAGRRLVIVSFNSGTADTLTQQGEFWRPVFSPDGNSIAFAVHAGETRGIYTMKLDGGHANLVIPYGHSVDWPYADSLLYVNFDGVLPSGSICISDTSGNIKRVIYEPTENINYATPLPKMHLGTRRIIFYAQEIGILPGSIWAIDPGSQVIRRLRSYAIYPSFSPDGNTIVFTDIHEDDGKLWLINWDGTGLTQLTKPLVP